MISRIVRRITRSYEVPLLNVQHTCFSLTYTPVNNFSTFTHVDKASNLPTMVDVSEKNVTLRTATAQSTIYLPECVVNELNLFDQDGKLMNSNDVHVKKGPIVATAIVAGTMAVKNTSNMIPFCHPLPIDSCKFQTRFNKCADGGVDLVISCKVKVTHKTGVEMEALSGVSVAALTVYDMCKALSHDILIKNTMLVEKTGGKSHYTRPDVIGEVDE